MKRRRGKICVWGALQFLLGKVSQTGHEAFEFGCMFGIEASQSLICVRYRWNGIGWIRGKEQSYVFRAVKVEF